MLISRKGLERVRYVTRRFFSSDFSPSSIPLQKPKFTPTSFLKNKDKESQASSIYVDELKEAQTAAQILQDQLDKLNLENKNILQLAAENEILKKKLDTLHNTTKDLAAFNPSKHPDLIELSTLLKSNDNIYEEQANLLFSIAQKEAKKLANESSVLRRFVRPFLEYDNIYEAVATVLTKDLAQTTNQSNGYFEELHEEFLRICRHDSQVKRGIVADLIKCIHADPAIISVLQPLLYFKVYLSFSLSLSGSYIYIYIIFFHFISVYLL